MVDNNNSSSLTIIDGHSPVNEASYPTQLRCKTSPILDEENSSYHGVCVNKCVIYSITCILYVCVNAG